MKSLWVILFLLPLVAQETEKKDSFIQNIELKAPIPHPNEAPDKWLLAHIDVETTGLLPGHHEMIDVGIVMTTLEGDILDSLFFRIQPANPERLSPGAKAVNLSLIHI